MKRKSFNLNNFSRILNMEKFGFVNLQYGNVSKEIEIFNNNDNNKNKIIDINKLDKFRDLDSLASLISSLDLVITVANINTNFSSSLGVETWNIAYEDN